MKLKVYSLIFFTLALALSPLAQKVQAHSEVTPEYKIKAAFIYNFIKFTDWPEEKPVDANDVITIGIIGENPFGHAFEPIIDKQVKNKTVVIKTFESLEGLNKDPDKNREKQKEQLQAVRKCHVLFICSSEKKYIPKIIDAIQGSSVLTISETGDFLETGGMINFLTENKKVRFEVNLDASEKEKIKISSKLLRLAKRVIKEKSFADKKNNAQDKNKPTLLEKTKK